MGLREVGASVVLCERWCVGGRGNELCVGTSSTYGNNREEEEAVKCTGCVVTPNRKSISPSLSRSLLYY